MTAEIGDDFILSFFVAKPHDPIHGRSIILMRDKKWEHLIAERDRGVTVSDEDFPENEEADNNFLAGTTSSRSCRPTGSPIIALIPLLLLHKQGITTLRAEPRLLQHPQLTAEALGVRQAAFRDRQFPAYTRPRPGKNFLRTCQF